MSSGEALNHDPFLDDPLARKFLEAAFCANENVGEPVITTEQKRELGANLRLDQYQVSAYAHLASKRARETLGELAQLSEIEPPKGAN